MGPNSQNLQTELPFLSTGKLDDSHANGPGLRFPRETKAVLPNPRLVLKDTVISSSEQRPTTFIINAPMTCLTLNRLQKCMIVGSETNI